MTTFMQATMMWSKLQCEDRVVASSYQWEKAQLRGICGSLTERPEPLLRIYAFTTFGSAHTVSLDRTDRPSGCTGLNATKSQTHSCNTAERP
jgi:hypothetical protein